MSQSGDMLMLLTHLVEKNPDYRDWARQQDGHYRILDNSLIELGGAVTVQQLCNAAAIVKADEIILPDVFLDGPGTLKAVDDALTELNHLGQLKKYKLHAVCQGKDALEFRKCYSRLEEYKEISVIGIPKVTAKLHPAGRPYFEGLWMYSRKDIHLLGLWYNWEELSRYKDPQRIRSCDSVLAAFQAYYRLPITAVRPDGWTLDLEVDDLDDYALGLRIGGVKNDYSRFYRS